ncbi:MAG: hypothetical protein J6X99_06445 [Bacteroidales bacterium]|nr:hypothetical protein [Bacteroidales bacterium]
MKILRKASYEAPLCEAVSLYAEKAVLQASGFGNPGDPGTELITDDPLFFLAPSILDF